MFDTQPMGNFLSKLQTFTLPFSEEGVLHQFDFVFEDLKLPFGWWLGQNIRNMFIWGDLELHCSLPNLLSNKVVLDLYVLGTIMEHWILKEFNMTPIIIVVLPHILAGVLGGVHVEHQLDQMKTMG